MTLLQAVDSIIVALIAGTTGGGLVFAKFWIERKDKKESESVQSKIDNAVIKVKTEMLDELTKVSKARSAEGAERFNIHAKSFEEVNKQISENTKQIDRLAEISTNVLKSMDSLNKVVEASAESQRNSNYDRLLIVGKKVLNTQKITLSEKTNMKQLYDSYKKLNGNDPYIETLWDECQKLTPIPDEQAR